MQESISVHASLSIGVDCFLKQVQSLPEEFIFEVGEKAVSCFLRGRMER